MGPHTFRRCHGLSLRCQADAGFKVSLRFAGERKPIEERLGMPTFSQPGWRSPYGVDQAEHGNYATGFGGGLLVLFDGRVLLQLCLGQRTLTTRVVPSVGRD
jgi:hypothetical protein